MAAIALSSCEKVKEKAGQTIDSGAQAVGKTATDIVNNIDKGITDGAAVEIRLSDDLKKVGMSVGKYYAQDDTMGNHNILSIYIITEKDLDRELHAKLFDKKGLEMGRTTVKISQKKGQATYYDFVFDVKADIENQSKLTID